MVYSDTYQLAGIPVEIETMPQVNHNSVLWDT